MAKQKRKITSWTEERRKSHGQKVSAAAARKRAAKAAATRAQGLQPPPESDGNLLVGKTVEGVGNVRFQARPFLSKIIKFVTG